MSRRSQSGYWRRFRRLTGVATCNCAAYWFPHRAGSCETGRERALQEQTRFYTERELVQDCESDFSGLIDLDRLGNLVFSHR